MNYSEQQIKKALRVFIEDPDTARKFADAMRKGLELAEMENEPHPFEQDPDEIELDLINEQLAEMMQRHGFEDQSTGGGCWGWFKNLLPDGSMYLQITVGDSQLTYDTLADVHQKQVCACVYINGEWQDQTLQYFTFEELKKVLKED
jgi:hypothetical protein